MDIEQYVRETLGSGDDDRHQPASVKDSVGRAVGALSASVSLQVERLLYTYYNWRRDTASDLALILFFNSMLIVAGSLVKYAVVDPFLVGSPSDATREAIDATGVAADGAIPLWARIWPDVYQVTLLTFGENFPGADESWVFQFYSIGMGLLGVVGFALVLALTEQIILEVLNTNVRQGTKVFESGHVLVLAQCVAGKDMETLWRILGQVIWAFASAGGTTVVVLTGREKLAMENVFREAIPDTKGSKFVFRQGNPLLPADLSHVGCTAAASVIVVSDNSREANEADAQTTRTVILLDELIQKHEQRLYKEGTLGSYSPPHVVVELLQAENCQALGFATDLDVSMILTRTLNAKRLARMVMTPVVAGVSSMLFDYRTDSQQYTQNFPELKGKLYKDVPFLFDMATVVGLFPAAAKDTFVINPSPGYVLQEDDKLLLLRSSKLRAAQVRPDLERRRPTSGVWRPPILRSMASATSSGATVASDDDEEGVSVAVPSSSRQSGSGGSGSDRDRDSPGEGIIVQSNSRQGGLDGDSDGDSDDGGGERGEGEAMPVPRSERARSQRFYVLPAAYMHNADENEPVKLLVAGWGEPGFMEALLHELDQGDQSLPVSSEVVFLNTHASDASIALAAERVGVSCLHVSHVLGNPLAAASYTRLIDISEFSCAMCLCDSLWVDPDADSTNGIDFMEQSDMLRLDSMLLLVQLHIRSALKAQGLQDISIICEKLAIAGVTRFEDRFRLPVGISVNMTSYAAKLLVQTMYDPEHGIRLVASFGRYVNVSVLDSAVLCEEDEELSWWDVLARAQLCRLVLFAYYDIPASLDIPLKLHSNPLFDRGRPRVWNDGSGRRKFICFEARLSPTENALFADSRDTVDVRGVLAADANVAMRLSTAGSMDAFERVAADSVDLDYMDGVQVVDLNSPASVQSLLAEEGLCVDEALLRPRSLRTYLASTDREDVLRQAPTTAAAARREAEAEAGGSRAPHGLARVTKAQSAVEALISQDAEAQLGPASPPGATAAPPVTATRRAPGPGANAAGAVGNGNGAARQLAAARQDPSATLSSADRPPWPQALGRGSMSMYEQGLGGSRGGAAGVQADRDRLGGGAQGSSDATPSTGTPSEAADSVPGAAGPSQGEPATGAVMATKTRRIDNDHLRATTDSSAASQTHSSDPTGTTVIADAEGAKTGAAQTPSAATASNAFVAAVATSRTAGAPGQDQHWAMDRQEGSVDLARTKRDASPRARKRAKSKKRRKRKP